MGRCVDGAVHGLAAEYRAAFLRQLFRVVLASVHDLPVSGGAPPLHLQGRRREILPATRDPSMNVPPATHTPTEGGGLPAAPAAGGSLDLSIIVPLLNEEESLVP